jgi:hypothetical protein
MLLKKIEVDFGGTHLDPITGRLVSSRCWDGFHQERGDLISTWCRAVNCQCGCHEQNVKMGVPADDELPF